SNSDPPAQLTSPRLLASYSKRILNRRSKVDVALLRLIVEVSAQEPCAGANSRPEPGVAGDRSQRRAAGGPHCPAAHGARCRRLTAAGQNQPGGHYECECDEPHYASSFRCHLQGHLDANPRTAP